MIYVGEISFFSLLIAIIVYHIIRKKELKNQDEFNDLYQKYNTWDGQNENSEN